MSESPGIADGNHEENISNSPEKIAETRIFVYNLDENKTPGRLKARIKIRVVTGPGTGPEARRLDTSQNDAIMELIRCKQRRSRHPRPGPQARA